METFTNMGELLTGTQSPSKYTFEVNSIYLSVGETRTNSEHAIKALKAQNPVSKFTLILTSNIP
jgi:hypothetical protein